jgi:hypothetical protein
VNQQSTLVDVKRVVDEATLSPFAGYSISGILVREESDVVGATPSLASDINDIINAGNNTIRMKVDDGAFRTIVLPPLAPVVDPVDLSAWQNVLTAAFPGPGVDSFTNRSLLRRRCSKISISEVSECHHRWRQRCHSKVSDERLSGAIAAWRRPGWSRSRWTCQPASSTHGVLRRLGGSGGGGNGPRRAS